MKPGDVFTCQETGKQVTVVRDGCSMNYAMDREGNYYSDEGVDIREKRGLLDRSKPFTCYISSDGGSVTGWKGNILGTIIGFTTCKLTRLSFTHGKEYRSIVVRDVHGGMWYGRGSPGVAVTLRPRKTNVRQVP